MSHKNKEGCAALHCRASSKGSLQHLWEQKHSSVSLKGAQKPRGSSGAARGPSACPDLKTIGVHASCELEPGWTSPWPAWGAGSSEGLHSPGCSCRAGARRSRGTEPAHHGHYSLPVRSQEYLCALQPHPCAGIVPPGSVSATPSPLLCKRELQQGCLDTQWAELRSLE